MKGHPMDPAVRERAQRIIRENPHASIHELTDLIGELPHGTVGNLRLSCIRAGEVPSRRSMGRWQRIPIAAELRERVVETYRLGIGIRATAQVHGVTYYAVRSILSLEREPCPSPSAAVVPSEPRLSIEPGPEDGLVVTCWCEAEIVRVDREAIASGETVSCGRPDCHA